MRNRFFFTGVCLGLMAALPAAAAASQENTAPEAYSIEVSASADNGFLTIMLQDAVQEVDRLLITFPDDSELILVAINNENTQFSFTVNADQQGETVCYTPGYASDAEVLWYEALSGTITIPQVTEDESAEDVTGTEEGTNSDAGEETSASDTTTTGEETSASDTTTTEEETSASDTTTTGEETSASETTTTGEATSASETTTTGEATSGSDDASSEETASSTKTGTKNSTSGSTKTSSSTKSKSGKSSATSRKSSTSSSGKSSGSGSKPHTSSTSSTSFSGSSSSHSGSSTGARSGKSRSSSSGSKTSTSSGSTSQSDAEDTAAENTVEAAKVKSSLGVYLLENGKILTYDADQAPEIEGMTYEAVWDLSEEAGIRIYLYAEGGAVLEISSVSETDSDQTKKSRKKPSSDNANEEAATEEQESEEQVSQDQAATKPTAKTQKTEGQTVQEQETGEQVSEEHKTGEQAAEEQGAQKHTSSGKKGTPEEKEDSEYETIRFLLVQEDSNEESSDASGSLWQQVLELVDAY